MNRKPQKTDKPTEEFSVILFDGVCNLCHQAVRFIIPRDPAGRFRFASLQSSAGQRLLMKYGLPPHDLQSVVVIDRGRIYTESTAALRIARHLSGMWPALFYLGMICPRPLRDAVYRRIASRRYQWFGKRECLLPSPEAKERFLDEPAGGSAS